MHQSLPLVATPLCCARRDAGRFSPTFTLFVARGLALAFIATILASLLSPKKAKCGYIAAATNTPPQAYHGAPEHTSTVAQNNKALSTIIIILSHPGKSRALPFST